MTTVTVTRKGQTTVPKQLREKYEMSRGTKLQVVDTGVGVLFRKARSTADLIGSSKRSFNEMKRRLDEIRREGIATKPVRRGKRTWKQLCGLTPKRTGRPEWPTPTETKNIWR